MSARARAALIGFSAAALATGLGWDWLVPGGAPGLGAMQLLICALGVAPLPFALLPSRARRGYARLVLLLGACYLGALVVEVSSLRPVARVGHMMASIQGMVQPSSWGGYELTPGWHGRYDDLVRPFDVDINAAGDRDDPPGEQLPGAALRVLLLGDSYTFGIGLARAETIEAQLERESGGRVAAYNLGVGGYGPSDTLAHYRERKRSLEAFAPTDTLFLLYGNDLRRDNCEPLLHTAVGGEIVTKTAADGSPYTPEQVDREIQVALREDDGLWLERTKGVLTLKGVRARVSALLRHEPVLVSGSPEDYSPHCALSAAARAAEMQAEAHARGERFAVVILPTPGETAAGRYAGPMEICKAELERLGVPRVEILARLTPADYFRHHEHLSPSGAHKAAQAILEALDSRVAR